MTTMDPTEVAALVAGLRSDANEYGELQRAGGAIWDGVIRSYDQSNVRAWDAAALIESLTAELAETVISAKVNYGLYKSATEDLDAAEKAAAAGPSAAQIEAAARAMFHAGDGACTWEQMIMDEPDRADLWRQDAAAVLHAAWEATS